MNREPEPEFMDLQEEADAYAAADFADVNDAFVGRLLEICPRTGPLRALDLGTGPGDIPVRLLRRRPAWHVAAADFSGAMLAIMRGAVIEAGFEGRILPVQCDAKRTPFPDAAFDLVFSNSILHHVTDTAALWGQVRRLLRPGGAVFFRDLARPASRTDAEAIVHRYAGAESRLLQEEYFRSLLSAYTVDEVRDQLRAAGLDALRVQKVTDRHLDVSGTI